MQSTRGCRPGLRVLRRSATDARNDIGEGEKLVGIEILDAKEVLGNGKLPTVFLENIPLAKAA